MSDAKTPDPKDPANRDPITKAFGAHPAGVGIGAAVGGAAVDDAQVQAWVEEFASTEAQVREAIATVGTEPGDIEMHLKGSRSSSNSDKVHDAGG